MNPLSAALDGLERYVAEHDYGDNEKSALIHARVRALLCGYHKRWKDQDLEVLEVEQMRVARLFNPDAKQSSPSRTFKIAGKIDVLARRHGRTVLFDHKTTSQDIADPAGPYWRQLAIEGQATHYQLLAWQTGMRIDEAVWDVVRKPQTARKKLGKKACQAVVVTGYYCGREMSQETRQALTQTKSETLEMYEARLLDDCVNQRPERYFQRRTVPRLDNEILEYASELWQHGQELLHTRRSGRHVRNSGACLLYGRPCKFLGICSGHDSPDSNRWKAKERIHDELPELEDDGRDVLTNSRIRCFQTCRRKHFYEYEQPIERWDKETAEALYFGSAWHAGLNAWMSCFIKGDTDGNGHRSAGSESAVGTAGG